MYYVYILQSLKNRSYYTGYSSYIPTKRVIEHNRGMNKYTGKHKPYELIFYVSFKNELKAKKFEKYLKHGSGHAFMKRHFV